MFQIFFLLILFHPFAASVQFWSAGKIGIPERKILSLYLKHYIPMITLYMAPRPVLSHEKWIVYPWTGSPNLSSHKLAMRPYICHIILWASDSSSFESEGVELAVPQGFFIFLHQLIPAIDKAFPVWLFGITYSLLLGWKHCAWWPGDGNWFFGGVVYKRMIYFFLPPNDCSWRFFILS